MPNLARIIPTDLGSGILPVEESRRSVARPERRMSAAFARDLRKCGGHTLHEVADAWGVSVSRVRQIEAGLAPLSIEKVFLLSADGLEWAGDVCHALAEGRRANDATEQLTLFGEEWTR